MLRTSQLLDSRHFPRGRIANRPSGVRFLREGQRLACDAERVGNKAPGPHIVWGFRHDDSSREFVAGDRIRACV